MLEKDARVALCTRAWIETVNDFVNPIPLAVALCTRAWIETTFLSYTEYNFNSRPLHEGVD